MSSLGTAHRAPQLYPAPSPHGDLQSTGLRGWVARRPLAGFLVIVLGLSWLLLSIPVLAPSMALLLVPICRWRFSRWRRRC
jgi:hypothetical protein